MSRIPFSYTHAPITCNSSSAVAALAASGKRTYALFVNDSDVTMYLSVGGTAAADTGIRLNPNGGSFEMSGEMGNLSYQAVTAITASGSSKKLLVTSG